MEYTLDQLGGVGGGLREGFNAFGQAVDHKGDVRTEFVVHRKDVEVLLKLEKARVRAKAFRIAHRCGKCKTNGLATRIGDGVQVIVCEFQGVPHEWGISDLAYALKYLRKACANLVPVEG